MRYAEPWLYGSVSTSGGLLLAPALVLCQCSDYVTGSSRSSSKKSPHLCKKCKGTRLPLTSADSKFGTVRSVSKLEKLCAHEDEHFLFLGTMLSYIATDRFQCATAGGNSSGYFIIPTIHFAYSRSLRSDEEIQAFGSRNNLDCFTFSRHYKITYEKRQRQCQTEQ